MHPVGQQHHWDDALADIRRRLERLASARVLGGLRQIDEDEYRALCELEALLLAS
jgi:hypothetical protein